ncbi:T9SS type A sorting domain-containing protein [Flavobacterium terrisoli]|uniref:T9SS type A sorting domain-containing protein n=1 Tax=Flavobacterium terrisoli TaxID=3242195 RepID=UPI002543C0FB|nr:T9SS type A sorting domain-containing protein [Flavobacterium buctense]
MKKITLLLTFLLVSVISEAQIIASQNFNTSLGWTSSTAGAWARRTTGGAPACSPFSGTGMARFNSYDLAAGTTARLTSPAIAFAGATYRVKFKMFRDNAYAGDADSVKLYYNTTGGAGGTLFGTVNRSRSLAPTETEDGWYSYSFDIPGTPNGNGYIHFLGTSQYGNNIFIDEITIEQIPAIDGELRLMNVNSYVPVAATSVSGSFKNSGSTTVTSFEANWQADSGTIYTQTFSGLNIAAGQTYNFTQTDLWNTTPGLYSLKLWISNINNAGNDADATNNLITKPVSVYSNTSTRFALYEKFSSSTCGPCYSFNTNSFNNFLAAHEEEFAFISYQVNWPGAGDPYYTTETGTRVGYYGISGAPTLLVDSKDGTNNEVTGNFNSSTELATKLTQATAVPSYFTIAASKTLTGSTMDVQVAVTPFVTGTYKLYAAVVEKNTYNNVASNGENEFHNVMMKMMPDANGTTLSCVHDVVSVTNLQVDLSATNIEELSDLEVVVFVQNPATKAIMQAKYASDEALATPDFSTVSKIKLYPNPSTGIVRISTDIPVDIQITDVTGKQVLTVSQATSETVIDLSAMQNGVYFAKITGENATKTQKILLQ